MTASSKIVLHHVGGRWGNHPFPRLPAFAGDFVEVLYEADTDAIAAIQEAGKDRPNEMIVIPACLADRDGEGLLHIYVNPGLTSLRELNRVLDRRYQNTFGVDFDFGNDGARLLQKRKIATRRLDGLIAAQPASCLPADSLSLDVHPANMRCCSGRAMRSTDVCGLIVEVEFGEIYAGQRRFQDVYDLLDDAGFNFVRFLAIGETLSGRRSGFAAMATRISPMRCFCAAATRPARDARRRATSTKLCSLALSFGVVELAIECLMALDGATLPQVNAYDRFVANCRALRARR